MVNSVEKGNKVACARKKEGGGGGFVRTLSHVNTTRPRWFLRAFKRFQRRKCRRMAERRRWCCEGRDDGRDGSGGFCDGRVSGHHLREHSKVKSEFFPSDVLRRDLITKLRVNVSPEKAGQ